jgi:predicted nucleic acid-binding protein
MHIELDDALVAQVDMLGGPRGPSAFVRSAIERAVRQELRWSAVEAADARQLFSGLVVLPVDSSAAWQAGTWRRTFAERGVTLYQADCLVAATALVNDATLATGNPTDFPMRELKIEHWPVAQ